MPRRRSRPIKSVWDADEAASALASVGCKAIHLRPLLAWLLRHPAGIQPLVGTGNLARLKACAAASSIELSREEWYHLLIAANGQPLP